MKNRFLFIVLLFTQTAFAQQCFDFSNSLLVSDKCTGMTQLYGLLPLPVTNQYQTVYSLDIAEPGIERTTSLGDKYVAFAYSQSDLQAITGTVTMNYVANIETHNVNFWMAHDVTEIYPYDTSSEDYIRYTGAVGDIIVPSHPRIVELSDSLFYAANGDLRTYAEQCYLYTASHFAYKNMNTGLHSIAQILADGGGDCGNFSTVFICLMRAKNIPARHVIAVGRNATHVWAEFLLQNYGWVPVDATYKHDDPSGNYFGIKNIVNPRLIVVQHGIEQIYQLSSSFSPTITLLQTFGWWYWYNGASCNSSVHQQITLTAAGCEEQGLEDLPVTQQPRSLIYHNGQILILRGSHTYTLTGQEVK